MYSSLAIANEFIKHAKSEPVPITHMQLQKLIYLADGWNFAINGVPLIEDDFEAWTYGAVIRKLYDALKIYGKEPIERFITWGQDVTLTIKGGEEAFEKLTDQELDVIKKIWDLYGKYPAFKLSAITHADNGPWAECYEESRNRIIPKEKIRDYFIKLAETKL